MMNEKALRFYALLEQAVKLDARDLKDLMFAVMGAMADKETRKQILDTYDELGYDIIEDFAKSSNTNSDDAIAQLKRELEQ